MNVLIESVDTAQAVCEVKVSARRVACAARALGVALLRRLWGGWALLAQLRRERECAGRATTRDHTRARAYTVRAEPSALGARAHRRHRCGAVRAPLLIIYLSPEP